MNLVVLLSRVPWPLDKGDKLRAYHQIRELSKNHSIDLIALNDQKIHPDTEKELLKYCRSIHIVKLPKWAIFWNIIKAFFSNKPLQIGYFYNSTAHRKVQSIISQVKPNHIYGQLVRVAEYIKDESTAKTLDFQDALSEGLRRRMDKVSGVKTLIFKMEYNRLRKYEVDMLAMFDHTTMITTQDRDLIQSLQNAEITVVPNGVDMEFFHPISMEKTYDVVFTGNMNYPPNIMAAKFLVNDILPLIQQQKPDTRLLIAGASPHPSVKALASESVTVSGWLDDIRTAYASSKIFVAPMQIGTGLQNKLLEAMAMKIPSVCSDLANKALAANTNTEIRVAAAQDAKAFAGHIIELLGDEGKAKEQAEKAYKFVLNSYSWKSSVEVLEQAMFGEKEQ